MMGRFVRINRQFWKCLRPSAKTALSALLVSQMLILLALAASPSLHEALHHDCGRPDHDCLVTTFVKGQLGESLPPPPVTFFIVFVICAAWLPPLEPRLVFQARFAPTRAPPRF
jgi:hypothetical protein